jgi:DNA polymerase elongation subunit (family B)
MAKIRFYPLEISYRIKEDKPVIYMYGRTDKAEQVCVIDDSFKPYFYVIPTKGAEIQEKIQKVFVEKKKDRFEVTGTERVKKNFLGKEIDAVKVFVNIPKGIPLIREQIKEWDMVADTHEYDIKFVRRYLIDKSITPLTLTEVEGEQVQEKSKVAMIKAEKIHPSTDEPLKEPRILAVDIETYNPRGKNVDAEKDPIIMIAVYGDNFKKVFTWKKFKTEEKYIEFVKSEEDIIMKFADAVEKFKPDVITGYFSDGFDFPYINTRAKKYKINLEVGLDYSKLKIAGTRALTASIKGIPHIDIFKFIRRIVRESLKTDSFTLDAVAHELLGENKLPVNMEQLASTWDKGGPEIEEYCRYNLHDAKLTYELCVKLFPNLIELIKIVGLPVYDVSRMSTSQLVEWYIIKQAPNFNEIAANRPNYHEVQKRKMHRFKGAFVFEPKPGLYDDIIIFDYRSLYPTIIVSHNIAPGSLNCNCCENANKAPGTKHWFCKKKKGFIPTIIEDLITRRMRIKEIIKKGAKKDPLLFAREQGLKLLANSFYGYLGFFNARWYALECAESTTAWGRHYITDVIDKATKEGFKVLYSDTDSVFLELKDKSMKDAHNFIEKINQDLPGLMELEFEGHYPTGIFVAAKGSDTGAKKKYALLDEKGELKITGFETVRRNISIIAKEVQNEVLHIVLCDKDPEKALRYVRKVVADLKENKLDIEKVTITTQLQKEIKDYESIGPHVAAAQKMKNKGIPVGPGSIIKYVIVKGKGKIRDKVKLPEDTRKEDYDPEYYINNQVIPVVDKILEVFRYKKEDLLEAKEQSKLGSFM